MITELKGIAKQIANSRLRLSSPYEDKQTRQDILDEAKRLEFIESNLYNLIDELEKKIKDIIE